jgi:kanosamine 6-kinase
MYYLGVDIGATKVALRVECGDQAVGESTFTWSSRHSAEQDVAQLADCVADLVTRLGIRYRAVGVAMPAAIGPGGRVVSWPSRPQWNGLDLGATLRALFPRTSVAWADDGDLGALAEAQEAGCENLLYLGVGTGIGGGLVLGGSPYPGLGRGSFEIGHLIVDQDGPRCVCGRRGCLQAAASGPATLRRAADLRGAGVTFEELRDGTENGDSWALWAVEHTCRVLAAAIAGVNELLHPQLILIGGGFAAGIPGFVESVSEYVLRLARPGFDCAPVRPALLGGLSSLRGAVHLARLL